MPHVTLKSIANNPEIEEHPRAAGRRQLEPRPGVNSTSCWSKAWEEWQVPRERGRRAGPSGAEGACLARVVGALRRERQKEIDAAIARPRRHRDARTTSPTRTSRRIRVTGPFTVESLSPHRVSATTDEERTDGEASADGGRERPDDFVAMILDNLKKAGVQNTRRTSG